MSDEGTIIAGHRYLYTPGLRGAVVCDICGLPKDEHPEDKDVREAEWLAYESQQLAKGRCPHSGEVLHRGGEAGPHAASCDMCDCGGYDPEKVKVWPRPLRVVRWKVTRKMCRECGRRFAADRWSSDVCDNCFAATLSLSYSVAWEAYWQGARPLRDVFLPDRDDGGTS